MQSQASANSLSTGIDSLERSRFGQKRSAFSGLSMTRIVGCAGSTSSDRDGLAFLTVASSSGLLSPAVAGRPYVNLR